jgi:hypothetical protein
MRFVNTFGQHRNEPGKSLDAYLKERRLALGKSIAGRHKVYLDTKYWLLLRNLKLGRSEDPVIARLSSLLEDGVQSGQLICPISADIFLEILKQTDPVTLKCSVELIDTLSEGVSVLAPEERAQMELLHFVQKSLFGEASCQSPEVFVWTKLAYVLGFTAPHDSPFSLEEELVKQKAFLDQMWEVSLADMIDTMGIKTIREMPRIPDISENLNAGKLAHASENDSFEAVFLSEVAGILDTLKPDFGKMFAYLYESLGGGATKKEISASDGPHQFANLIYHGFRLKRFSTELPSVRIPATLQAAIRWEPNRKYNPTDMPDIGHAEVALPYFDTFLTEHSLRHLLTRTDLGLDRLYRCTVISDPNRAVEEVEKVISRDEAAR